MRRGIKHRVPADASSRLPTPDVSEMAGGKFYSCHIRTIFLTGQAEAAGNACIRTVQAAAKMEFPHMPHDGRGIKCLLKFKKGKKQTK